MGKQWKQCQTLFSWPPKSLQMDCSHEIKRHLLLGRKVMTNLDSTLKSRDITLPTKVRLVKAMVFPVVMYGCESWTIKKAEHWRIDAFESWCWRRLLRVPWTARSSNQSILKEISPGYSLEGLMLKLKLQYFGHLMQRVDSSEKTLMLGKIEGRRRMGWEDEMVGWHHWLYGHEFDQLRGIGDGQGSLVCCSPEGSKELDMSEWLNWTELTSNTTLNQGSELHCTWKESWQALDSAPSLPPIEAVVSDAPWEKHQLTLTTSLPCATTTEPVHTQPNEVHTPRAQALH